MHVTISSLMLSLVWSECKNCKATKSKQCDCAQIVCIRACGVETPFARQHAKSLVAQLGFVFANGSRGNVGMNAVGCFHHRVTACV